MCSFQGDYCTSFFILNMLPLNLQHALDGLRGLRLRGPFVYKDITGSTNDDAREAALDGISEGAVFIAEEQSHGRGRQGRRWVQTRGQSLLFSVVLRPALDLKLWPLLSNMTAVAVAEAVSSLCGLEAATKWPNDVLVGGRKIAGILVEARAPEFAIVGIGVNLLQETHDFPPEVSGTAASLAMASAEAPEREAVLAAILNHLDDNYHLLLDGQAAAVVERQRRIESTLGRQVVVDLGSEQITGEAVGLAPAGGLVIDTGTGQRLVTSGEVVRVRGPIKDST